MFLFTIADPAEEAVRAQNDPEFMNRFIERNRRFVMFCAFRTLKHFVFESDGNGNRYLPEGLIT